MIFFKLLVFLNLLFLSLSAQLKTISEDLASLAKEPHHRKITVDYISHRAVLKIYQEDFSESFNLFEKLYKNQTPQDPFNLFYMAMNKSALEEVEESIFLWNSYLLDPQVIANKKVWLELGRLVKEVISNPVNFEKKREKFKRSILFFYLNQALYTSMLNINIYENYLTKKNDGKIFLEDINFIILIKSGILSKVGYKIDAIKLIEKYKKKYQLDETNLKQLGVLYYQREFFIQALETFALLKDDQQKDFKYYYYLTLTYSSLKDQTNLNKNRELAKTKIINEHHEKLYQKLVALP